MPLSYRRDKKCYIAICRPAHPVGILFAVSRRRAAGPGARVGRIRIPPAIS